MGFPVRHLAALCLLPVAALLLTACQGGPDVQADAAPGSTDAQQSGTGELSVGAVRAAITATHAGWVAGETSVSELGEAARMRRLGVPLDSLAPNLLDLHVSPADAELAATLPATLDWRNKDGKNYVSPILDQGDCGSCVAFAVTATFESQLNIAADDPSSPFELSPQYLFACGGGACGYGWTPASAARFLKSNGMPDNACMPYTSGAAGEDAKCKSACSDLRARVMKPTDYTSPSSSITAVKTALLKGPLVTTMTVYDDFMFYVSGVYKHVTGPALGGHAVSIVGWNDEHQAWIVRNSWGAGWGMQGFFEVAYSDSSGVGSQTWSFSVTAPTSYVSMVDVRDNDVLAGPALPMSFSTKGMTDASVAWTLAPKANPQGSNTPSNGSAGTAPAGTTPLEAVLDTTTLQDGVYMMQAEGKSASQSVKSQPRQIYVLNGTETGSIRFTSLTAGQTVKGVQDIDFTVSAAPIPLSGVRFMITDASGTVVTDRTLIGNTGAVMKLGWNTARRKNGQHTISLTGIAAEQTLTPVTMQVMIKN